MGKTIKVPDDVYDVVKKEAEKQGLTISEYISKLVKLGSSVVESSKTLDDVKSIKVKEFPARYEGVCYKCGGKIRKGEWITYVIIEFKDGTKRTETYHVHCYSTELAKKFKAKVELELIVNELRKEARELAVLVLTLEPLCELKKKMDKAEVIIKNLNELFNRFNEYSSNEVIDKLAEIYDSVMEIKKLVVLMKNRFELVKEKKFEKVIAQYVKVHRKSSQ